MFTADALCWHLTVHTVHGSKLHCALTDAFLRDGGYALLIDGEITPTLCEVMTVIPQGAGRYAWRIRYAEHAGRA